MPQSHSCCQTTTVPDHLAAIKSSSDANSNHSVLVVAHMLAPTLRVAAPRRHAHFHRVSKTRIPAAPVTCERICGST
jgi:hypothetical protein